MNRNKRIVVALSSLAMAALLLIPLTATAAVVLNVHIPVSGAVFNPCNGETVTFSGIDYFTASVTLDAAGGFHSVAHDNIHVTATGS